MLPLFCFKDLDGSLKSPPWCFFFSFSHDHPKQKLIRNVEGCAGVLTLCRKHHRWGLNFISFLPHTIIDSGIVTLVNSSCPAVFFICLLFLRRLRRVRIESKRFCRNSQRCMWAKLNRYLREEFGYVFHSLCLKYTVQYLFIRYTSHAFTSLGCSLVNDANYWVGVCMVLNGSTVPDIHSYRLVRKSEGEAWMITHSD